MTGSGPLLDVAPVVLLNGQPVATGWAGQLPLVLDGLSVTWGREAILEQAQLAVGRLQLFDPTRTWATDVDRRGQLVQLRYAGSPAPDGTAVGGTFFRGRVGAPLTLTRKRVTAPDGSRVDGVVVEVPLQSILADLGNVTPRDAWPVETLNARLARIVAGARAVGVLTGGAVVRDYWGAVNVDAVAAADQVPLLEHLLAVYASAGSDTMAYRPGPDDVVPVTDRTAESYRTLGRLFWDGNDPNRARAGQGVYVRTWTVPTTAPQEAATALYLDAALLEYDPSAGLTTPSRITRVALTHPNGEVAGYPDRTVEVRVKSSEEPAAPFLDEGSLGARTARVESLLATPSYADVAANDLALMVRREGSRWLLDPVRYRSRRAGGFPTLDLARTLLAGYETNAAIFLQRSWLPTVGVRPVVGVMGGVIAYADGGWDLELQLAPVATALTQHAVTFEELDDGSATYEIQWWDDDHPKGMHASLTFEDLDYVGSGLNVTTQPGAIPVDSRWDRYQ